MKASRVKIGFRRLALVLMVPFAFAVLASVGMGLYILATMPEAGISVSGPDYQTFVYPAGTPYDDIAADLRQKYGRRVEVGYMKGAGSAIPYNTQMWARNDASNFFMWAVAATGIAMLTQLVVLAIGWIIAGFAGND